MDELLTAQSKLLCRLSSISKTYTVDWENVHILVALSGGLDSVCMLRILDACKDSLGFGMRVIHFNHGLRDSESDSDADFCVSLCDQLGFKIDVVDLQMSKQSSNLQATARERRKKYYDDWRRRGRFHLVATAHHKDDFIESFFIGVHQGRLDERLIPLKLIDFDSQFLRPLVIFNKCELKDIALKLGWDWREDSSNLKTNYLRNFYRKELLLNSNLAESVYNFTGHLKDLNIELNQWLSFQLRQFDERDFSLDRLTCLHWENSRFRDFWLAVLQRHYPQFLKGFDAKRLNQIRVQKYRGNRRFQIGSNGSSARNKLILVETRCAYHLELE